MRATLAYDGSGFHGWAIQQEQRTVQFEIENTLGALIHELDLTTVCAGRTDAGVHARGQVIHFDVAKDHPDMSKLTAERINKALPEDIRIVSIGQAPHGFDARFSALWREYSYTVCDSPTGPAPLRRHDVLPWPVPLDLDRLNEASAPLVGTHDFFAFCKEKPRATTIRDLLKLDWHRTADDHVVMTIRADAFCYSMVRSVVGALLPIGDGRKSVSWTQQLLDQDQKNSYVQVMEPWPLVLEEVGYPPEGELLARQQQTRARRK
jgi:tRNA pseudouridine38-40 synthase